MRFKWIILIAAILLSGCKETTTACQNALGCDHEGHAIVFRGIGD